MPVNRRDFLQRTAELIAVAVVTPALSAATRAEETCTTEESESLRISLNYADPSPDPGKRCADCAFFTAAAPGGGCGNCEMLSGDTVAGSAHCDSWSPRG